MAARSGSEFLGRLATARVHVEIQGETLTGGVAGHPAFRNVVRSFAELYDMQHDPAYRDILTYPSPATGEPVEGLGSVWLDVEPVALHALVRTRWIWRVVPVMPDFARNYQCEGNA